MQRQYSKQYKLSVKYDVGHNHLGKWQQSSSLAEYPEVLHNHLIYDFHCGSSPQSGQRLYTGLSCSPVEHEIRQLRGSDRTEAFRVFSAPRTLPRSLVLFWKSARRAAGIYSSSGVLSHWAFITCEQLQEYEEDSLVF